MKREAVNGQVPSGCSVCTSESCSERTHCSHAHFASQVLDRERTFALISSHHLQHQEGKAYEPCHSGSPERYARRLARATGEMSHNSYVAFTDYPITEHAKTQFYRIKRGGIPLSPTKQAELQALLRTYGCTGEGPFDSCEMRYTQY